jgi:PAS domain S-box-containing protein
METVTLTVREDLAQRVQTLAQTLNVSVDDLISEFLDRAAEPPAEDSSVPAQIPASVEYLRILADHATDLICLHAPDGRYLYVSPSSLRITGYAPVELLNANPYDYLHPDDLTTITQSHQTSLEGQNVGGTVYRFRQKSGDYVWLETYTEPVMDDGEIVNLVTVSREITERRVMEEALRQESERKSRFISMVSHELRTPMAIITTSTGILRQQFRVMREDQVMSRLERIDLQIKRLSGLLDDVTFINRTDLGKLELRVAPVDLSAFFEQIIADIKLAYSQSAQITLTSTSHAQVVALDEALLHQICTNLLSNAIKYSPHGHPVTVTYGLEGQELVLSVKDEGIGIPEDEQAQLFERFFRASNISGISGTGLGLPITQQAVAAMGGTITFNSTVGVGTTFTVRIPYAQVS